MFSSLILASLLVRQNAPDVTIPIQFTPLDGIPLVTAKMSGKQFTFALDTGSPYSVVISTEAAKQLDIDLSKVPSETTAGIPGKVVPIPAMDVAGTPSAAHFDPFAGAVAIDMHDLTVGDKKVDGILGLPVLGMLKTEFDYSARKVIFHRNPLDSAMVTKMTSVPYVEREGAAFLRLGVPGGTCEVSLDTGREHTLVAATDREKLKATGSRYWTLFDLYDNTVMERLYVPNVSFAGVDLGPAALQLRTRGGLLGNDILYCFRFILDPENHRVLFQRAADKPAPSIPGDDIFGLEKKGDKFIITMAFNLNQEYNLKDGDALKVVDGVPLATMDPRILHDRVTGLAGTIAHLVVERDGKDVDVLYKRPSAYDYVDDPKAAVSGIASLNPNETGDWVVMAMKASGPLWKAGIRPGDVIIAVDDEKLAGMSIDRMKAVSAKMKVGGCVLTVKSGDAEPRKIKYEKP